MSDWKHELSHSQYEFMLDCLMDVAKALGAVAEKAEIEHRRAAIELARHGQELIVKALAAGDFDNETIIHIQTLILKKMTGLSKH